MQVHFKTLSSKGRKELLEYIQEFQEFEEILKKICTKVKDSQVRKQEKEKKEIAKLLIASDLKEFRETLERRAALSPEERDKEDLEQAKEFRRRIDARLPRFGPSGQRIYR